MVSSLFGESASNLRSIFDYCQHNPSVLLLDECDFIARSRENSKDIGEVHRIVNTLLQLLEDYDPPGLVVATTNLVDQLDKALFRRFDDALLIPVPGEDEIIEIMKASTSGLKLKPKSFPWEKVSSNLLGTSAANIVSISRNACKDAVLKNKDVLELSNFEKALKDFNRLD
jgi:SpoVK/Ycf46/Vps4 family AAA+-type ATPase